MGKYFPGIVAFKSCSELCCCIFVFCLSFSLSFFLSFIHFLSWGRRDEWLGHCTKNGDRKISKHAIMHPWLDGPCCRTELTPALAGRRNWQMILSALWRLNQPRSCLLASQDYIRHSKRKIKELHNQQNHSKGLSSILLCILTKKRASGSYYWVRFNVSHCFRVAPLSFKCWNYKNVECIVLYFAKQLANFAVAEFSRLQNWVSAFLEYFVLCIILREIK